MAREPSAGLEEDAWKAAAPQPARQPLTSETLEQLYVEFARYQTEGPSVSGWFDFARAIESAHGIGGQP